MFMTLKYQIFIQYLWSGQNTYSKLKEICTNIDKETYFLKSTTVIFYILSQWLVKIHVRIENILVTVRVMEVQLK